LTRQTLRALGAAKEIELQLMERLMALAAAHTVLSRESWSGGNVVDIVREVLTAWMPKEQVEASGPPARVAPNMVVPLSLALHELAANAVKHGALSVASGHVRLVWVNAGRVVLLEWRESRGPPVAAPARQGFGFRLLQRGLAGKLGRPAELIFDPKGLICRIRVMTVGQGDAA
jgi:two-component sensor histidine kinase